MVEERIKDATKILNLLRSMADYRPHFEILGSYRLIDDGVRPEATIMVRANGREMHEADTGVGPVDALAKVLKKSLKSLFPEIDQVKLIDFSARVFDPEQGPQRASRWRSSSAMGGMPGRSRPFRRTSTGPPSLPWSTGSNTPFSSRVNKSSPSPYPLP